MEYFTRSIENNIKNLSKEYPCLFISGPKGAGKTTLLTRLKTPDTTYVTLSNLSDRLLAQNDPADFFLTYNPPIIIDDIHYAPKLITYIKQAFLDDPSPNQKPLKGCFQTTAKPGDFWLVGSFKPETIASIQKELPKKVCTLYMSAPSQEELRLNNHQTKPDTNWNSSLNKRKHIPFEEVYEKIWLGSLPDFWENAHLYRSVRYDGYIQAYIEQVVSQLISGVDYVRFYNFIRETAWHSGQLLNIHSIAKNVGIADDTAKRWLQVLEQTHMIFYAQPYGSTLYFKRNVRKPKLYFFDTGLLAHLINCDTPEDLQTHTLHNAIIKTYVISELKKNLPQYWPFNVIFHLRTKDGSEIDYITIDKRFLYLANICCTTDPPVKQTKYLSNYKKHGNKVQKQVYSLCSVPTIINNINVIPIGKI